MYYKIRKELRFKRIFTYMKKILSLFLIFVLCLSLAACTSKEQENFSFDNSTVQSLITNTKTKDKLNIVVGMKCKDLGVFDFESFDQYDYEKNQFVRIDVEPNKYSIRMLKNKDSNQYFTVVVRNLTDKTQKFEDCELVYIKYSESADISVFGATIGMHKDEIVKVCGTPSAESIREEGGSIEYQFTKDGCSYNLTCLLDENLKVYQFLINIGNIPIYDHLTGGVEIDTELSEEEIKSAQDAGMPSTFDELPDSAKEEIRKQLEEQNKK